jgi:nitrite reductase/ring-hydroxylating ferredoxin subunit
MIGKLKRIFGKKPAIVKGTAKLEEGQSKRVEFGDVLAGTGVEVVLCRVGGKVLALDTRCPHEGGRIVDGPLLEGRYAVCPLHNYAFDPRTGEAQRVVCKKARTYRVQEDGDQCEVWL